MLGNLGIETVFTEFIRALQEFKVAFGDNQVQKSAHLTHRAVAADRLENSWGFDFKTDGPTMAITPVYGKVTHLCCHGILMCISGGGFGCSCCDAAARAFNSERTCNNDNQCADQEMGCECFSPNQVTVNGAVNNSSIYKRTNT